MRSPALALILVVAGCEVPQASPPPRGQATVGQASPACACYFETWSYRMGCGARCIGDARLVCTSTTASVDPTGCAVGAPADGGATTGSDAGAGMGWDAAVDSPLPGGGEPCTTTSSCTCLIYPYDSTTLRLTIPCCATVCVESQQRAWSCSENATTTTFPAVCLK